MIGAPLPASEYDEALRQALRRHRKRIGVSKAQLAVATGISAKQIQRYEAGTNKVSVSRLMQLSHALGVPASHLIAEIEVVPSQEELPANLGDIYATQEGRELASALPALLDSPHLGLLAKLASALAGGGVSIAKN